MHSRASPPSAPLGRNKTKKFPYNLKSGGGSGGSRKKMKGNFGFVSATSQLRKGL